jgi:L-threonylcarbamoyladenylate synthase
MSNATHSDIQRAVQTLQRGELVGMPTETVYGLAGDARNESAIRAIFARKGRPPDHPLIVHLHSANQLLDWAEAPNKLALKLAQQFWPGPLTLILHKAAAASPLLTGGQNSIGVRVPSHPVARELLRAFGGALAAPSANRFGHISPTKAAHVREEFGTDLFVLDGGSSEIGIESTIVDARGLRPTILRPGRVSEAEIMRCAAEFADVPEPSAPSAVEQKLLRVSGALETHYAPRTPCQLVDGLPEQARGNPQIAVLALDHLPSDFIGTVLSSDPAAYAFGLYNALRQLDSLQATQILVVVPPKDDAWIAIWDRLSRACTVAN